MAINNGADPIPVELANTYRVNWQVLRNTPDIDRAFRYIQDEKLLTARSFELSATGIAAIFGPKPTAIRIYPSATAPAIIEVGADPIYLPLVRGLRETPKTVEFSDYYPLLPVSIAASQALPPGANQPDIRMMEITTDRREQYRQEWDVRSGAALQSAFVDEGGRQLVFHHFDSQAATRLDENHLARLIALAEANGDETRFFLHLGYDAPGEETRPFGYRSVLEMQNAVGDSLNFQYSDSCPPWCDPPQRD